MTIKKISKRRKRIYIQLINDDINSFDYVIKCLMTICGHNYYQAHQCALMTHNNKICNITSGFQPEILETYMQLMKSGLSVDMSTNKNFKK
tara:strand:+ start:229 stop:501 length:273 start_codon:yes stop_codon:yes gene_type:complete